MRQLLPGNAEDNERNRGTISRLAIMVRARIAEGRPDGTFTDALRACLVALPGALPEAPDR